MLEVVVSCFLLNVPNVFLLFFRELQVETKTQKQPLSLDKIKTVDHYARLN